MQIRSLAVGAAGATLLVSGLAFAGSAAAAPATPSLTASPVASSAVPSTPATTASPTIAPAPPVSRPTVAPGPIQVPAGNAGPPATSTGGATSLEIAGLIGVGALLLGSGAVVAVRRRG